MLFEPVRREFSFTHQGNRLVGDLVRPPWPGPYPAVVFVEGSGPGGRDQGSWPARLAAAGFASPAYDKPGSGASTGDWTPPDSRRPRRGDDGRGAHRGQPRRRAAPSR